MMLGRPLMRLLTRFAVSPKLSSTIQLCSTCFLPVVPILHWSICQVSHQFQSVTSPKTFMKSPETWHLVTSKSHVQLSCASFQPTRTYRRARPLKSWEKLTRPVKDRSDAWQKLISWTEETMQEAFWRMIKFRWGTGTWVLRTVAKKM